MKNTILLSLAVAVLGLSAIVPAGAQSPNANPPVVAPPATAPHQGGHLAKLAQELGLSANQVSQIKSIHADAKSRVNAIKSNPQLTAAASRQRIAAVHKASKQHILSVLTPQQRQELKAIRKANKG